MSGLNYNDTVIVKPEAADLAAIFLEVLDAVKNSPTAVQNFKKEHEALKETKAAHQKILDENQKILTEHKNSRAAWAEEQRKTKLLNDAKEKEYAEREAKLTSTATSLNVRDSALGRRQKEQDARHAEQEAKAKAQAEKDLAQDKREKELREMAEKIAKEKNDWRATQEAINRIKV